MFVYHFISQANPEQYTVVNQFCVSTIIIKSEKFGCVYPCTNVLCTDRCVVVTTRWIYYVKIA